MRIEHVAMYVKDLEEAKAFFVNFFDGVPNEGYHNPDTDFRSYFLTFEDGARLEIMHHPDMQDPEKTLRRTGLIHLAFSTGSRGQVDALTARLRDAGYAVLSGPRVTGDGYYESCISGIEGCQVEITV